MNQLGYFGKTPHRGDFLRFNLPQSFTNVWDDWLQQVMINGEASLQSWATVYAKAPMYRFALSSGIAGAAPWIGILRPSQDKVGRRFPFCLAMALPEMTLPCVSLGRYALWFDEADALVEKVFTLEYDFDDLQGDLAKLSDQHALEETQTTHPISQTSDPAVDAVTISMHSSCALLTTHTLPAVVDTVLQQTLGEYSLWTSCDKQGATVINAGLPTGRAGLALFDTQWVSASTAFLDVDALLTDHSAKALPFSEPSGFNDTPVGTVLQSTGLAAATTTAEKGMPSSTPASTSPQTQSPAFADEQAVPLDDTAEQIPSADDWAALDVFTETTEPYQKPVIPEVEPLELDDDNVPDAPWEQ